MIMRKPLVELTVGRSLQMEIVRGGIKRGRVLLTRVQPQPHHQRRSLDLLPFRPDYQEGSREALYRTVTLTIHSVNSGINECLMMTGAINKRSSPFLPCGPHQMNEKPESYSYFAINKYTKAHQNRLILHHQMPNSFTIFKSFNEIKILHLYTPNA